MSGGSRRWRWRFDVGVSPVRVSIRIGRPISRDRRFEIACDIDGERLQRRDVERVQPLGAPQILAGRYDPARFDTAFVKLHQRRQKARQRLAAAGRRDQQHRAAVPRTRQELELMRARRPSARRKPLRKNCRQQRRGFDFLCEDRIHGRRYVPGEFPIRPRTWTAKMAVSRLPPTGPAPAHPSRCGWIRP